MYRFLGGCAIALSLCSAVWAADDGKAVAARFGARPSILQASLSPDGKTVAFVVPMPGKGSGVLVAGAEGGASKLIAASNGDPLKITDCNWSATDRIVCSEEGLAMTNAVLAPFRRTIAFDSSGANLRALGREAGFTALRISQFDGEVLDWLTGSDGKLLMARDVVPQESTGTRLAEGRDGLGVEKVDTRSGNGSIVEQPDRGAAGYISDGLGHVRIRLHQDSLAAGQLLNGATIYEYRTAKSRDWHPFSRNADGAKDLRPIAVDGRADVAYALKSLDGRDALYRVALDGSMKTDLVYANPTVDVDGVVTIGRGGRVIGASYVTDRQEVDYFDPEYKALAAALARALPKLPLIDFISASADEKQLLIRAASDSDPGHYYGFDRATLHLNELGPTRPELEQVRLSQVRSISYRTRDGVTVPAYLTLPPGSDGKHVPAIVMPHGGPASRDQWGFDWLAQFFAQRGFAVLQPEFRGSSGYGDAWYVDNGFKSWRTAITDIDDGARWMEQQGIADPDRLAIVGWSYGGYAALQANVFDPGLFNAAVAIAPVTDLDMLKQESQPYTNRIIVARMIGSGPHIAEGSPARHADRFQVPVLLFHGDQDLNVGIGESRAMDAALRRAGKQSELIVYPGLDHQLDDDRARTDMLTKADAFLRANLKIAP